jgi:hypothetical protein
MPQHNAIKIAIANFQGGDECILSPSDCGLVHSEEEIKLQPPSFPLWTPVRLRPESRQPGLKCKARLLAGRLQVWISE